MVVIEVFTPVVQRILKHNMVRATDTSVALQLNSPLNLSDFSCHDDQNLKEFYLLQGIVKFLSQLHQQAPCSRNTNQQKATLK